jgi:hypothetical protein
MSSVPEPVRLHGRGPLPTHAELDAVEKALGDAYNGVEDAAWRTDKIVGAWAKHGQPMPEGPPTLEQFGYLYLFALAMQSKAEEIRAHADSIIAALPALDDIRLSMERGEG